MTITTTTHLNFRGDARAALERYQAVFGGELAVTTCGDVGMPASAPGADRVVFGQVASDARFRVMAYDIPDTGGAGAAGEASATGGADARGTTRRERGMTVTEQPWFVSVRGETLEEVQGYWDRFAPHATIVEPLAASAWSPGFGMLTDAFGVTWILDVAAPGASTERG